MSFFPVDETDKVDFKVHLTDSSAYNTGCSLGKCNTAAVNVWGFSNNTVLKPVRDLLRSVIETENAFINFTISVKGHHFVFSNLKLHYPRLQNTVDDMNYIEKLGRFAPSKHAKV